MTNSNSPPKLTRRRVLKQAGGAGLTLAAAQALSPLILSGHGQNADATIKVGILHSLTGVLAINETQLRDAELLAIDEINKAGGVLKKKIEPIVEDPESKFTDVFPEKAKKLLVKDKVAAVFGCWVSVARKNVLPVFENENGLLFYPVPYEGNECSKNVVYTGAVLNQQVLPAVEWLMGNNGGARKRFYLLGSDFVFPRTANYVIKQFLAGKPNVTPVGELYTPFGHGDFSPQVKAIVKAAPDVIFNTIFGDDNVAFFDELAKAGITPDKIPVCTTLIDEDDLRGLDAAKVKGHFAASNYFQSINTPQNKTFVANLQAKYGKDRVATDAIVAAYFQVYLWKLAVEKAGSTDVDKVRTAVRGLEFVGPGGKVKVDEKNQHTWKQFRVGKITDKKQFEIVFDLKDAIQPDPYPAVAFPGWGCDWTKGGMTRGKEIELFR